MFGNLKEKFERQLKENETRVFTKKEARARGLAIFITGLLALIPSYFLLINTDLISVFLVGVSIACILGGIYIMVTGKIPKPKK